MRSKTSATHEHDRLVRRLALILMKLNDGERLRPADLAREFGVTLRTVQRDLNERFDYLPLQKADGRYRLDPALLGKLTARDIERFAALAGVAGLFPPLADGFLREIFDARMQRTVLVRGAHYEDMTDKAPLFAECERAIDGRLEVSFRYARDGGAKLHDPVAPYKLLNHNGIWYLIGTEAGRVKSFALSRIESLLVSERSFTVDAATLNTIEREEGIWFGGERIECVIEIAPAVAATSAAARCS
jgi:predicted DNA-binding transcriptional regulator YafY